MIDVFLVIISVLQVQCGYSYFQDKAYLTLTNFATVEIVNGPSDCPRCCDQDPGCNVVSYEKSVVGRFKFA